MLKSRFYKWKIIHIQVKSTVFSEKREKESQENKTKVKFYLQNVFMLLTKNKG